MVLENLNTLYVRVSGDLILDEIYAEVFKYTVCKGFSCTYEESKKILEYLNTLYVRVSGT